MKRVFTQKSSISKLAIAVCLVTGSLFSASTSYAQKTYFSRFANPTGKYSVTDAGGCDSSYTPPPIQNKVGIADNDESSVAFFTVTATKPYNCTQGYTLDASLNLPVDSPFLNPGNNAGWRISVPTGTNIQKLGENLIITTFLDAEFKESKTGSSLLGVDAGQNGKEWFIYFQTTEPFNTLELAINPNVIDLDTAYTFAIVQAFGGAVSTALPATIANYKATVSGKNVNLSWQSLTETNVSSYRIERSNGNNSYTSVANVPAKGNSSTALSYAFTDKPGVDGNYLYRVVVVNNDGTFKATNSLSAVISGQGTLLLYPTIVKAGQNVTVKTSETGLISVYLFDAQGRLVKQQRSASSGQFTISTTGLSNGVYNVKVVSASGAILQSKIVVN